MKKLFYISAIIIFSIAFFNKSSEAKNSNILLNNSFQLVKSDSMKALELYSLFSEYYKNKDYLSAKPFGYKLLKEDPRMFAKYFYYKMEDLLWKLHDSTGIDTTIKNEVKDTILYIYNAALKYYPSDKGYWEAKKAYVSETWLKVPADTVINEYKQAFKDNPGLSSFYYDRLAQLYVNNASSSNDYKSKAIDIYQMLSEKEPDNPAWNTQLESLVENIDQLVQLTKKAWELNKNDLSKAWKYAMIAVRAGNFKEAIVPLEFLVSKDENNASYWTQLANAYQKAEMLDKAVDAYKKLIQLEPDKKEDYLNLGIVYKDKGDYVKARAQYLKASEVGKGWGLPIYYEGNLYEDAGRKCEFNFDAKLVYLLAVETYRKALRLDPTLSQAQDRIGALKESIPTKEDYFFRGYKSGKVLPITGSCFGWINRSVTVP